jgi:hypothetical protein
MIRKLSRVWTLFLVTMNLAVAFWMATLAVNGRDDAERAVYSSIAVLAVLTAVLFAAMELFIIAMERTWRK